MAEILDRETETYERERHGFMRELKQFHDSRSTTFRKVPTLKNKEIDLYLLYVLVTSRGGWQKVNSRDEWEELLSNFKIKSNIASGSLALKQIYIRYLDHYEKIHFHGEDPQDQVDQEDSNTGHRKKVVNPLHNVPLNYNHNQHTVSESTRNAMGMSTNVYQGTEYDRLGLSLISPLPNEQDFGINVCTLLANEGRHTLKLDKYPRLLDYLLFHAGCFSHKNLRQLHDEYWIEANKYNLVRFWEDLIFEERLRDVLLKEDVCKYELLDCMEEDLPPYGMLEEETSCPTCAINLHCLKPKCQILAEDKEILNLQRTLEVRDKEAQRVLQIANILRNASFEEGNAAIMGRNRTCLRFLLLCMHCGCGALPQLGLDTLGNIASEMTIHDPRIDPLSAILLKTLTGSLSSSDRAKLIGALECLNKLAQRESNEDILSNALEKEVYEAVSLYLSVSDILLLIHTLECLYSLSSLGEKACVALTHVTGALATLVSLLTVEAQSYGPKACILMKVIETAPAGGVSSASAGSQNTFTEAELYAMTWLRNNLDVDATSSSEQGELYRRYVRVVTAQNKVGALTSQQFSNCVRVVFGGHVGPIQKTSKAGVLEYHYDGIKSKVAQPSSSQPTQSAAVVRPMGSTVSSNPTVVQTLPAPLQPTMTSIHTAERNATSSPILKATLSSSTSTQVNQSLKVPIVQPSVIQKPPTPPKPAQVRPQAPVIASSNSTQIQCPQSYPIQVQIKHGNTQQQIVIPHDQLQNLFGTLKAQIQMANPQSPCVLSQQQQATPQQQVKHIKQEFPNGVAESNCPHILQNGDIADSPQSIISEEAPVKGILAEMLEKRIGKETPVNGLVDKEIRISDKGLEVVMNHATKEGNCDEKSKKRAAIEEDGLEPPSKKMKDEPEDGKVDLLASLVSSILDAPDEEESKPEQPTATPVEQLVQNQIKTSSPVVVVGQPSMVMSSGSQPSMVVSSTNATQGSLIQVPASSSQPRIVMGTSQGQLMLASSAVMNNPAQGQLIVLNQNGAQYIMAPQQNQTTPSTVQARLLLTPGSTTGQLVIGGSAAAATPSQPSNTPTATPSPGVMNQQQGKAFIIVHPQQGQKVLYQVPQTQSSSSSTVSSSTVSSSPVITKSTVQSRTKQPLQTYVNKNKVKLPVRTVPPTTTPSPKDIYICEWAGCNLSLGSARSVYMHACEVHCPEYLDEIPCLWERCDQMPRRRFSLMTHLLDRHCNEQVLVVMAARRRQLQEIPEPAPPPPHPGYAHNAAYQAIRRHALESSVIKDLGEKEGPVTKSIRLTSALILRNMCIYSSQARRLLRSYESHLTSVALSSVESSRTVSQILYDLSHDES